MAWTEMLQQAIQYMEAHLLEDVDYKDVARRVHMSQYEFHRLFTVMAGMTANAYIRNRRLSLAGVDMTAPDAKVIDVALKYGYDTPESFAKAFARFHGVAPRQARAQGVKLCLFNPLVIRITMEGGSIMDYRMEVKEGQQFLCVSRTFRNDSEGNNEVPSFWQESNEKGIPERLRALRPAGKRDLYGMCTPTRGDDETFDYGIGVLLDDETAPLTPSDMDALGARVWETGKQQYVVFECMGATGDCIGEAWSRFFKEFLPQTGYASCDSTDYEVYYEQGKPGMFGELWIPVKKGAANE